VTLHARDLRRAGEAARLTNASAAPWPPARASWDLLVNAPPAGTFPRIADSPMSGEPLNGRFVYDLVYNPPYTRLLADAHAAGCETLGGLPMLVEQARLQFEWWTGVRPERDVFEAAALTRLAEMNAVVVPETAR
jgi:shikimate 5-dehydrogenase